MLDIILGRQSSRRDGVSRRDFLRVGAVGALGLPALLRGEALPPPGKNRAKSVILVFLGGGLSHHDNFDLKPEAPPEVPGWLRLCDGRRAGSPEKPDRPAAARPGWLQAGDGRRAGSPPRVSAAVPNFPLK